MLATIHFVYNHGYGRATCPLPNLFRQYPSTYIVDDDRIIERIDQEPNNQYKQFSEFGVPRELLVFQEHPSSNMNDFAVPVKMDDDHEDEDEDEDVDEDEDEDGANEVIPDHLFNGLVQLVVAKHLHKNTVKSQTKRKGKNSTKIRSTRKTK